MKNWINKNYKTLIISAFLIPIITVAIVSISHVTKWYGISNPVTWAIYLSIGVEIAALSALAAISANMGSKVYFPFSIVTLIQFIGNIYFAYQYIDTNSESFKQWVELVSPLLEYIGVEPTDYSGHKRFLSLFGGGMLPVISLSFLHMLVKFTEEDRLNQPNKQDNKEEVNKIDASDLVGEVSRIRLSENDLKKLEEILVNPPQPNDYLKKAANEYKEKIEESNSEDISEKKTELVNEDITPANYITKEDLKLVLGKSFDEKNQHRVDNQITDAVTTERERILSDITQKNQEMGLYEQFFDNPMVDEEMEPYTPTEEEQLEFERLVELQNEKESIEPTLPKIETTVGETVIEPPTPTPTASPYIEQTSPSTTQEVEKKKT